MDLGSALMSAEMALEFLPEEQRDRYLCEAPLVEGAIAAAGGCYGSDIKVLAGTGGADSKSSAIKSVIRRQSSVAMNKGQQTKDNRQKKPTDCSQSFRITRPSSGSHDSNPISVPNGAELNERHRTCSCGEH